LTVLPLLAGERSPGWATNATGSIIGLRLSTTPLDILQAALEGVALRLALLSDQVHKITEGDTHIIASGGALASSPAWTQIISSALNRPLHITAEQELTARGTALLAKRAIGNANLNDFPPKITHTVEPDERQVKRLRAAGERQVQLYNKIVSNEN
jgi:gluconokinase